MTSEPKVSLVVNGQRIGLAPFIQAIIGRAVLGMVVSLKGVDSPEQIQLDIKVTSS